YHRDLPDATVSRPPGCLMNVHDALLKAITDSPDDDAPRLVYADWLDEHGQPERAEFIRLQIELAKPPARGMRTKRLGWERRVKALCNHHGRAWARAPGGGGVNLWEWERGFCSRYRARDFVALALELPRRLREAPIQHVSLSGTREDVARLVRLPLLSRLRSLEGIPEARLA